MWAGWTAKPGLFSDRFGFTWASWSFTPTLCLGRGFWVTRIGYYNAHWHVGQRGLNDFHDNFARWIWTWLPSKVDCTEGRFLRSQHPPPQTTLLHINGVMTGLHTRNNGCKIEEASCWTGGRTRKRHRGANKGPGLHRTNMQALTRMRSSSSR